MPDSLSSTAPIEPAGSPQKLFGAVGLFFFQYFRWVGVFFKSFLWGFRKRFRRFYHRRLYKYVHRLDLAWLRVLKFFSRVKRHLFFHFYMFLKFFVDAWNVVRGGYRSHPNRNVLFRLCYAFGAFCRGVRNNAHIFVTIINYALPVVAVFFFVQLVQYVFSLNFAVDVEYNGEHIGYIQNEAVYQQAEANFQSQILYQDDDDLVEYKPTFEVTIAPARQVITKTNASTLTDAMLASTNQDVVRATGITVDGRFLGAVRDSNRVYTVLTDTLDQFRTSDPKEELAFANDIVMQNNMYLKSSLRDEDEIIGILTSELEEDVYDTVQPGDAPSLIAQRNNMTLDELVALNPDVLESLPVGRSVKVHSSRSYLQVKSIREIVYSEPIPYETVRTPSNKLWEGTSQITTAGVPGENEVTAKVAYVNGVEVSREILSKSTISEPVSQQVAVGTKVMPKVADIGNAATSSYGLIWPTQMASRYVSDTAGGWRQHRGIDIAFRRGDGYGSPVLAVLPGTVTYAGWHWSYGYYVDIDHGNGMKTRYAHNSKLRVSVGQTVAQGQVIANAGSTGTSTGTHIHFELYLNGVRQNPLAYLP